MKIVRPICCGMDVHKNIIVATIGITNKKTRITEYIQETFSTLNPDLLNLKQWLINHKCFDACMESTGKYWIPIFNILEDEINIYLTHPKYVKAIKGKKTDKKDSKWICDLFKHDLIKFSFIPPKEIRALREISRYRYKLVGMRSSERNRYQNCMTVSNIGIGSVFSDPFGKSAQAIMKEVLESDIIEDEKILKCIHGSCKNKDKILDSIKHCNIETDQRFKMNESMTHMEELQVHINNCEIEIMKRAAPMFDRFMHITQLPGISTLSAILIISEIGVDMKQFESDKQLACWAGLALQTTKVLIRKNQFVFLKRGQYLKPLLVQCALGAIKDKEGYFGIKYSRIKKRRGHKKAIIAIARMMLVSIYHMILTGETFNPSDYESFKNPKPPIKQQVLTEESAIEFLKKSGFDVSKLTKP
ncbi:MAG: IS110 family transposase [Catenibacterium sp.]|uniref:IS110 family transposase n=1 Tax=Catenibacterium sp. TaxID=2049022 RepID=UPI0039955EF0